MLNKKIGDSVKKGEILFTIFAEKRQKLSKAYKAARPMHIFYILDHKERKMLIERV
jgi:thymidine phosphorylase